MNPWLTDLAVLFVGFLLLARGASWLVDGAASLAIRMGVSHMVVGLTVVAWGTSMPEVVVSGLAAWEGRPASSLGNVLGSNVANVGLVLGASALVLPSVLMARLRPREVVWLLGSVGLLWAVCGDRRLTRNEAALLLLTFLVYNALLFRTAREARASEMAEAHETRHPWLAVVGGSAGIAVGAKLVLDGATSVAARLGMGDTVLGLTILAVGTSLPELFAGVGTAIKGHPDIGMGNVIGSNVFNSLAVTAVAAAVRPFGETEQGRLEIGAALGRDFPAVAAFSIGLLCIPLIFRRSVGRGPGALLLLAYLGYMLVVSTPAS